MPAGFSPFARDAFPHHDAGARTRVMPLRLSIATPGIEWQQFQTGSLSRSGTTPFGGFRGRIQDPIAGNSQPTGCINGVGSWSRCPDSLKPDTRQSARGVDPYCAA